MRRFPSSQVRTETMQDVGKGPSPFSISLDEDETLEEALITLTERPVPRPPQKTRTGARKAG